MSMNPHSVPRRPKNKLYFLLPPDASECHSQSRVPQTGPRIVTVRDSHRGLLTRWQHGREEACRRVRERAPWHPPSPDTHCCGSQAGHFASLSLCFFPCRTWTATPSALEGLPGATFRAPEQSRLPQPWLVSFPHSVSASWASGSPC